MDHPARSYFGTARTLEVCETAEQSVTPEVNDPVGANTGTLATGRDSTTRATLIAADRAAATVVDPAADAGLGTNTPPTSSAHTPAEITTRVRAAKNFTTTAETNNFNQTGNGDGKPEPEPEPGPRPRPRPRHILTTRHEHIG